MKKIWLLMIVCLLVPFGTQAREIILSAGGSFCYAVDADGTIWGWGDNTKGQLGNGTKKRAFYPQQAAVTLNGNDVLAIDCGNENALFLLSDGTVWTCGPNNYGQQGSSEAPAYAYEPIRIPGLENIVQISSGWGHCMARTADGKLYVKQSAEIGGIHIGVSNFDTQNELGKIYSEGKTTYNAGTSGFYMDSSGKFGIGSSSKHIQWDGSDLEIKVTNLVWTATNSSMTANGTLTATNADISETLLGLYLLTSSVAQSLSA